MSLVNDMLRDLDQRREKPQAATQVPLTSSAKADKPGGSTRWWVLGLAGVVTAGAVGWLLLNPVKEPPSAIVKPRTVRPVVPAPPPPPTVTNAEQPKTSAQAPSPSELAAEASSQPLERVTPITDAGASITHLQWQPQPRGWQLQVGSATKPRYELLRLDGQSLQLLLPDTRLQAALPVTPATLVEQLQLNVTEGGLMLQLNSLVSVDFQVVAEQMDGAYQLQITLTERAALVQTDSTDSLAAVSNKAAAAAPLPTQSATVQDKRLPVAPLQKRVRSTPEQRDQAAVASAVEQVRQGRTERAIEQLRQHLVDAPTAMASRELLATLLISAGRSSEAADWIEQGLQQTPAHSGLRKLKARLLIADGSPAAAAALLSPSQPNPAEDAEYHQLKAVAEQTAGQHSEAVRSYHGLLRQDAGNPAWWLGLGLSLEALDQRQAARGAYANVLQIPRVPDNLRAQARQRLQRLGG